MENESNERENETRGMKYFDPSISANIAQKDRTCLEKDMAKTNSKKNFYDSEEDKSAPLDSLPFGGNEGKIILENGDERSVRIAKNSGVPLSALKEYKKTILNRSFKDIETEGGEE